jgi:hypothetical protein
MNKKLIFSIIIASFVPILLLNACTASDSNAPAAAVESYIQALVNKDENAMINYSCTTWEENAKVELNSFTAVTINLENLQCEVTGEDNNYKLVSCEGKIIAGYGNEDLVIDLSDKLFQVLQEDGEWRMCGYHQ